jgi:hypothetical protein
MAASNAAVIPDAVASNPHAHPAHANPQARDSLVIIEKPQSLGMTPQVVEVDEESLEKGRIAAIVNPDRPAPTQEESQTLRRVSGPLPWIVFVFCIVEFAERGSYYAASQVFANFMNFPLPPSRFFFGSRNLDNVFNTMYRWKRSRCRIDRLYSQRRYRSERGRIGSRQAVGECVRSSVQISGICPSSLWRMVRRCENWPLQSYYARCSDMWCRTHHPGLWSFAQRTPERSRDSAFPHWFVLARNRRRYVFNYV